MIELLNTFVSLIFGFIIAISTDPLRKRLDRTSIAISFDKERDTLITPDDEHEFGTYIKIRLENRGGNKYARNIRCYLTSIEKKTLRGDSWHTIFDIPLPLIWSYKQDVDFIDLPPKMWAYFNVVSFNKGENRILPATHRKPFIWKNDLADEGYYRFNIYVTGENIVKPIRGRIDLLWVGKWDSFEMENFHQE